MKAFAWGGGVERDECPFGRVEIENTGFVVFEKGMRGTVARSGWWEVDFGPPRGFRGFEGVRVDDGGVTARVQFDSSV